jgi:hypothetical protein
MNLRGKVWLLVLIAAGLLESNPANGEDWISDRTMAANLIANGISIETDRATLWFEAGILSSEEMTGFADLANRGILDIEAYLGSTHSGSRKIRYFISTQVQISHSRWQTVFLPMSKVQNRTAPYLHETTHVVAPCDDCPMWFSEGLASYVQSYISEHAGGYDGGIFSREGNRGIDHDARRWLASERGRAVIPFLGIRGEPAAINDDRANVAAPFYVMAQSFVKFLVERAPLEKLRSCFEAKDFDAELQNSTGKSATEWKQLWLAELSR